MELNHRLQVLEGEMKIVKGEVKEILAEIRSFLLNKDNPFTMDAGAAAIDAARIKKELLTEVKSLIMSSDSHFAMPSAPPSAEIIVAPIAREVAAAPEASAAPVAREAASVDQAGQQHPEPQEAGAEETPGRLHLVPPGSAAHQDDETHHELARQWNLLTISNLALWAEDAVKRIGPKRLEMMLELCEIGGRIDGETKAALLKVIDFGAADPARAPTSNESLLTLRELEALLHDEQLDVIVGKTSQRSAPRRRR